MRSDVPLPGYHPIARLLHWSTVPLVIVQFGLAFAMSDSLRHRTPDRIGMLHMSTGVLILGITLGRLTWRTRFLPEASTRGAIGWEEHCARAVHLLIYSLLVLLPLSGMISACLRGWAGSFTGIPIFPATLSQAHATLTRGVATLHATAAVILLIVLGLHLLGVSYHLLRKDGVVERMLPESLGGRLRSKPASRS
jgi:cytochrome b561